MTHKHIKYFFGKVTMYTQYDVEARDLILYFMDKYFGDRENLLVPIEPLILKTDRKLLDSILCGTTYQEDYKLLSQNVRARVRTSSADQCIHEPFTFHEMLWNGVESRFRRR